MSYAISPILSSVDFAVAKYCILAEDLLCKEKMLFLPLPLTIFDLEILFFVDSLIEINFPQKFVLLAIGLHNFLGFRAASYIVLRLSLFLYALSSSASTLL